MTWDRRGNYRFGDFGFDAATGELSRGAEKIVLRPQVAAALVLLLERAGDLVSREELRAAIWPEGRIVSFDMAISTVIRQLRRALGDDPRHPDCIETIPKRGYRFIAAVTSVAPVGGGTGIQPGSPGARSQASRWMGIAALALTSLMLGGTASPPVSRSSDAPVPMLAVLPFENLTGDDSQDVLAHAMTDAVIGHLSRIAPDKLRVAGRASVLPYSDREAAPDEIAGELEADYLLEGSFARQGGAVTASARLLEAGGAVIWSRDFRRAADSPELAARSLAALAAEGLAGSVLLHGEHPGDGARVPAAVAQVREGLYIRDRLDRARAGEALDHFRQAAAADPSFTAAHEALAETLIGPAGPHRTAERVAEGRAAARRALELDPLSATAHRVLGKIAMYYDRDWDAAGEHLARAVELAPGDAVMHHALSLWYSARGRHAEALDAIELARVLDPRSVAVSMDVMFVRFYARDWPGAIEGAARLAEMQPGNDWNRRWVFAARLAMGESAAVAAEARERRRGWAQRLEREPGPAPADDEAAVRAYFGMLAEVLYASRDRYPVDPLAIAQWYSLAGREQRAAELISEGVAAEYFSYFAPFLGVSPMYDPLRGTAAFENGLRRLAQTGLSPTRQEARIAAAPRR